MFGYWKLALAILLAGILVWGLRTASPPNPLYPPKPVEKSTALPASEIKGQVVRGRVVWKGDKPIVPPMRRPMSPYYPSPDSLTPNPLAPKISQTGGLADVFLVLEGKGTESVPSKSFPLRLEWENFDCRFVGKTNSPRFAIARKGDEVEFVSKSAQTHSVQARGADFFTLPLPVVELPVKRALNQPGLVEISSGSWYYWAQARIWVSEHGANTLSDQEGKFELRDIPEGVYELSAIRANWNVVNLEGDPEFPVPVRAKFAPDVVIRKTIRVSATTPEISFELDDALFKKNDK